jgi:hypothetical protein
MTLSEGTRGLPAGMILCGVGAAEALESRLAAAAERLGVCGGWPLRRLDPALPPPRALASLGDGRATDSPPAWLAVLPVDPGLTLGSDGTWAEALGAWRQPTLLLLAASQLATGWPAAATALLRQAQVPLVGLIQWGGTWDAEGRRTDGLPWLGFLAEADDGGSEALAPVLLRRWRGLDLL